MTTYKAPQHARDHRPDWVEGGPGSDPFDWLPEPGVIPWIRLKNIDTAQTINSGSSTIVLFQEVVNDYPTTFGSDLTGGDADIDINEDGLYSGTVRIAWVGTGPGLVSIMFNGIDPDGWASYPTYTSSTLEGATYADFTARLAQGDSVFVQVHHLAGVSKDISGGGGTYFEMRKLGSSTVTGREADS